MNTTVARIRSDLFAAHTAGLVPLFEQAAARHGLPVDTLVAVAHRESCLGTCLASDGTGDHGRGRGIMQIDDRWHPAFVAAHANTDHAANIDYGAKLLADELRRFGRLDAALAAYNAGAGNVNRALRAGRHPDAYTTGGNYSADVQSRAGYFRGFLSEPPASLRLPASDGAAGGILDELRAQLDGILGRLSSGPSTLSFGFMPNPTAPVGLPGTTPSLPAYDVPATPITSAPIGLDGIGGIGLADWFSGNWSNPTPPVWAQTGPPQHASIPYATIILGGIAVGLVARAALR